MSRFNIGDEVRKVVGYPFVGTVVTTYLTEEKCAVRHKDGWDHIFHDKQLSYDHQEYQYLDLVKDILDNGVYREGRNGGTYGLFGRQIRFDLSKGFPLLTTKKLYTKAIVVELLWFLTGNTNIKYLNDQGITIWDEWADENGDLGPVYGKQWRMWEQPAIEHKVADWNTGKFTNDCDVEFYPGEYIDQISEVIEGIKKDPNGRRHLVVAWNPGEINNMALPPCHCLFQFFVSDGKLSCQLYQRSADVFLGVPFNIASYALLTHMIARECNLEVGEFIHTFGDVHLYSNHVDQAIEQITREPKPFPKVWINPDAGNIFDLAFKDIAFINYLSHPPIKGEVSV